MDPLSLNTGVLALLGACSKASRLFSKVKSLRKAPELIQAVNNEISDLHLMLLDLSDQIESQKRKTHVLARVDRTLFQICSSTLDETKNKILEIESLMQYRLLKPESDKGLVVNKSAFFQDREKLLKLQMELRDARQKLANLSCTMGMRDISRVEVILSELHTQALPEMLERQHKIENTLDRVLDLQMKTRNDIGDLSKERMPRPLSNSSHPGLEISVSRAAAVSSRTKCTCSRRQHFVYSKTILGSLFLGYTAVPVVTTGRHLCLDHCKGEVQVVYTFPSWFWSFRISMQIESYASRTMLFSLSLAQTISETHIAWSLISQGNLRRLRELLVLNKLSLKAEHPSGCTLLAEAVWTNASSARFLIEMGADIYYEPGQRISAQKMAWNEILAKKRSLEWRDDMRSLFPEPNFDDLYGFSPLHKAVLGMSNRSLQNILGNGEFSIDKPDCEGRTALSWAASRNDTEAVRMLLSYGADIEIASRRRYRPVNEAAKSGLACLELLIAAGANVTAGHHHGFDTLLHVLLSDMAEEEIYEAVQLLLDAGANINVKDSSGQTPLIRACYGNHTKSVKLLIERGADLTSHNNSGDNALLYAIRGNRHAILQQLLSKHLDHTGLETESGSLLHLAAEAGDTQTLKVLAKGNLKRRNTNIVNRAKLTPWQVASQRTDVDSEWRDAFFSFMRAIDENVTPMPYDRGNAAQPDQGLGGTESESEEDDQEFVEALESQL